MCQSVNHISSTPTSPRYRNPRVLRQPSYSATPTQSSHSTSHSREFALFQLSASRFRNTNLSRYGVESPNRRCNYDISGWKNCHSYPGGVLLLLHKNRAYSQNSGFNGGCTYSTDRIVFSVLQRQLRVVKSVTVPSFIRCKSCHIMIQYNRR